MNTMITKGTGLITALSDLPHATDTSTELSPHKLVQTPKTTQPESCSLFLNHPLAPWQSAKKPAWCATLTKPLCGSLFHCLGIALILLLLLQTGNNAAWAEDKKIRLQLKWSHQFQFAGYYVAQEKGYYQEKGLAVEILPCEPGDDCVGKVVNGQAEFGVGTTDLLLLRQKGIPVVVLATIFQHSPLALLTLHNSGVQSLHGLAGKRVMVEPGSAELIAYLRREGLKDHSYHPVAHGFSVDALVRGEVDAMTVYVTDEPFALADAGLPFVLYSPRNGGIDFYGDNLFTTEKQIRDHPEQVRAFREASLRGWQYAMTHLEEVAKLIHKRYPQQHDLNHLLYEAQQMVPLMRVDLVAPGHMYEGRWRHIAEVYSELGMLKLPVHFEGFLYNAEPKAVDLTWIFSVLAVMGSILALAAGIAYHLIRLNKRLKAGEKSWQYLFDAVPMALIVTDPSDRIIGWNTAASRLFGWSLEEALGQPMVALLVPETDQDAVHQVMDRTLREMTITYSLNKNRTKSGAIITCEWYNTLHHPVEKPTIGAISIGVDVSARVLAQERNKQAKELAEQLLADQKQFLSMVSHEIRSPLASVASATQLLGVRCATLCEANELLERIHRGVQRVTAFMDNCLSDSRLEHLHVSGLRMDEGVMLDDFMHMFWAGESSSFQSHRLLLEKPAALGNLWMDAHLLRVVLSNLLDNARKYSPPGTEITLKAHRDQNGWLTLSVQDQGMGITSADLPQVTNRYFRGHNAQHASGAGLGLYLVKQIVHLYQGEFAIASQPGQGTCATVHFPARTPHRE
ncbi:ABC transporter substrate-binding protein [Candidatus Magnetaquicoccus inordinatus]|uniref:ABC transporter substrate-binding protein n=1 Tax=Candidatus Magnetaquicoccus inordinatus TaxID=2496818 RepID=UPI00102B541E|nr:ABC transporter substrate-binding protein [Candidatus Magnetaquicoccus inordinatus]